MKTICGSPGTTYTPAFILLHKPHLGESPWDVLLDCDKSFEDFKAEFQGYWVQFFVEAKRREKAKPNPFYQKLIKYMKGMWHGKKD